MTLVDRCSTCGSLWRVHPLSAPRQTCAVCGSWVCGNCLRAKCSKCHALMHAKCAHMLLEDPYCWTCYSDALREALKDAPLDERLAASVVWAEEKKDKGVVHPLFVEIMGAHFGKGWNR